MMYIQYGPNRDRSIVVSARITSEHEDCAYINAFSGEDVGMCILYPQRLTKSGDLSLWSRAECVSLRSLHVRRSFEFLTVVAVRRVGRAMTGTRSGRRGGRDVVENRRKGTQRDRDKASSNGCPPLPLELACTWRRLY